MRAGIGCSTLHDILYFFFLHLCVFCRYSSFSMSKESLSRLKLTRLLSNRIRRSSSGYRIQYTVDDVNCLF